MTKSLPHKTKDFFTQWFWLREIVFVHKDETGVEPVLPDNRFKIPQSVPTSMIQKVFLLKTKIFKDGENINL